jgi:hypothetical protein
MQPVPARMPLRHPHVRQSTAAQLPTQGAEEHRHIRPHALRVVAAFPGVGEGAQPGQAIGRAVPAHLRANARRAASALTRSGSQAADPRRLGSTVDRNDPPASAASGYSDNDHPALLIPRVRLPKPVSATAGRDSRDPLPPHANDRRQNGPKEHESERSRRRLGRDSRRAHHNSHDDQYPDARKRKRRRLTTAPEQQHHCSTTHHQAPQAPNTRVDHRLVQQRMRLTGAYQAAERDHRQQPRDGFTGTGRTPAASLPPVSRSAAGPAARCARWSDRVNRGLSFAGVG